LTPDSGEVDINGFCPWKERKKYVKQIGVVFGQRSNLWWDLPASDSFELFKSIYKIPNEIYKSNMEMFTELLELDNIMYKPVRQMSLGQRMRCEIVCAFLHNPEIVFLDEPTIGLDIVVKEKIRNIIKTLNREKGVTILLTTHDISDVEELCSRVIIIDKGQKVYDDSLEAIKHINGNMKYLMVEYKSDTIINLPEFNIISEDNRIKTIEYSSKSMLLSTLTNKLESFGEIVDIEITGVPIEKIVKDIYNEKIAF
jgi:ABC-2 type transport system ATP-binding protein